MSLESLTTPLTADEVKTAFYDAYASVGGDPTKWRPGSPTRTLVAVIGVVVSSLSRLQVELARSGFRALAKGEWLDLVGEYVYDESRIQGTFAAGNLTLTNTGGGLYSGAAGDLVAVNSSTGKTYRNAAPYSLGVGATISVPFSASERGSASNAVAGEIDTLQTALIGVTVTNPSAFVGADTELDEAYAKRCGDKLDALSPNGPKDAYGYVARTATDVLGQPIGVTRHRTVADARGGIVVYVASASGAIGGVYTDPATPLGRIQQAIERDVEPNAVSAVVASAASLPISVSCELHIRSSTSYDDDGLETIATDAAKAFLSNHPIGGYAGFVYRSGIIAAISEAVGEVAPGALLRVNLQAPAADLAISGTQAPVIGATNLADVVRVSL